MANKKILKHTTIYATLIITLHATSPVELARMQKPMPSLAGQVGSLHASVVVASSACGPLLLLAAQAWCGQAHSSNLHELVSHGRSYTSIYSCYNVTYTFQRLLVKASPMHTMTANSYAP